MSVQSPWKDMPSRAHVRLAPIVTFANIYARDREDNVFLWQRSVAVCKKGRKWYWYTKLPKGAQFIALSRKRDGKFFLSSHASETPAGWVNHWSR